MKTIQPGQSVAFIGTGVMGLSMAGHLLKAGYKMRLYSRTKAKAQPLLDQGAQWFDSPADASRDAQAVITIVGMPHDVEEVYLGEQGILSAVQPGAIVIDMTTSCPLLAQKIAEKAKAKKAHAIDAPVSGGDVGAREARLSIMVGAEDDAFAAAKPLFDCMGKNIVHQGPPGAGQHTKMCNQIAIASNMMGVCEAITYAKAAGLDPDTVLKSISAGAAGSWSLSNLAPRILKDDYAPGFYIKHFIKDMKIAIESAKAMKLDLPGLSLACSLYEKLASQGHEDDGTQALFKYYASQLSQESRA